MNIKEWIPGTYPIPFFQTWCCENSATTPPSPSSTESMFDELKNAGLPPKMYSCIHNHLVLNRVGEDCIHYLFHDRACREFIAREYPPDVLIAYDRLIPTAFKADLWRYCVLYKYGGVYLDAKLGWGRFRPSTTGHGGGGAVTLRMIVERWLLSGGGGGGDALFVLERDGVGLWPTGHFGIHNAFIITKPKNPLLLDCIFNIVSSSKNGGLGDAGVSHGDVGWMTRPLFVTGPGLLGNVWRKHFRCSSVCDDCPDSYATMAPYFRLFFEGDGCIGYFLGDGDFHGEEEEYIQLLKVYDGYHDEYSHKMSHTNCVPHYTVLWSQGVVWGGASPNDARGGASPNDARGGCVPQRRQLRSINQRGSAPTTA